MKINAYTNSDVNMYLSNTYMMYKSKPIKITHMEQLSSGRGKVSMHYSYADDGGRVRGTVESVLTDTEFELSQVPLGYYTVNNTVVYLYKYQRSHFKKSLCSDTIRHFTPQDRELRLMNMSVDVNYDRMLLKGQEFSSLDEAFEKLKKKKIFSVALHPNYALVKKGSRQDLVIYYKTDPVITYDGETLTPLVDECHVTKFKLEMDLCD